MIKKSIPCATGNGWKLAKMHELLHLLDNTTCFGAATNFTAESPENFLKRTVKKVGKKYQKRKAGTMFEQQAACCLSNYLLLEAVHTDMNHAVPMAQTTTENDDSDGFMNHPDKACICGYLTMKTGWNRICQPHSMCSGQLSQMSTSWPLQIVCWPFLCKPLARMAYICVLSMNVTNIHSDVIQTINLQARYLTGCGSNSQTCWRLVALPL